MDFFKIKERSTKDGVLEVYPDFIIGRSTDLMVRSKAFYAVWDQAKGLWSTDEYDLARLVDEELDAYAEERRKTNGQVHVRRMSDWSSTSWMQYRSYVGHVSDNAHELDENLTFENTVVRKQDYVSKRLPYPLEAGSHQAYDDLISVLYASSERQKLEWAIGAVISGDAKEIQKFVVLYGEGGSGKSTFLNIVQDLFEGYYTTFEAKELTSNNNSFATEAFRNNPLVAIQHDGDLSRIEDNTKLNSIVSHEEIVINEKYKATYTSRVKCMLFMGTNTAVKITNAKSGLIRRLIDVKPTGDKIPSQKYQALMTQIQFELGAIAQHCLDVYRDLGKNYYAGYKPVEMMFKTDVFYNFVEENYFLFKEQDGVTLNQAWTLYKEYVVEAALDYKVPRHKFREELKNYFRTYEERARIDDQQLRCYYSGFLSEKFHSEAKRDNTHADALSLDQTESLLDAILADEPAQYATDSGIPSTKWSQCQSHLRDLDTHRLHYVKVPVNHIVIDFDLAEDGKKSFELNLAEASKWPPTYAETSQSGNGIHLHYFYEGDATELSRVHAPGIEVKVFTGDSSLRRKLGRCNATPIATINSGLSKKEPKVISQDAVKSEKGLRDLIQRNLRKEIHPGTKPSIDFIAKILDDAYKSGLPYDVTNLRPQIMAFANNSTHQASTCLATVAKMKFKSETELESDERTETYGEDDLFYYDVEVFPNLFVVCWKRDGDPDVVKMINPTPAAMEQLLQYKLIGFNCRRYDNHIIYARYMGYSNEQLYDLSQRLINNSPNATFMEAYSASYTDVYDFSSKKQSLKRFEIELGIHHQELGIPWDQPVPEDRWAEVADYCANDVVATEATFHARHEDFVARQILAALSGLTVNDTTQKHTARILFGKEKNPQREFIYTDLAEMFPGYTYSFGTSEYRGENPSEGGYVYAEPGMYSNVALLDIASMHPTSLINLNAFGDEYTQNFKDLLDARIALKHGEFDQAREMLDGRLAPFLVDTSKADDLAYALKIVINIVYGLTSAKFENPFKDPRNVDNIVAKRGSLFMIELKHFVQEQGFTVAHIKTDSIKIPDATSEIIEKVMEFGKKYGYSFEHEATYEKMCLVNDAVYVAKVGWAEKAKKIGTWEAVGAQFQQPYVYKTLFTHEPIEFKDMCETKTVQTALYLDMNEGLPEDEHNMRFVGKAGLFTPVVSGAGGGWLTREKDGKYYAATGAKSFRWMESEMVEKLGLQDKIDLAYYQKLVDGAIENLSNHGDVEAFLAS